MSGLKYLFTGCLILLSSLAAAVGQDKPGNSRSPAQVVTAVASGEQVRITAPASVVQMHVEVYATSGKKLFDNEIRGGNVFDWHLQDGQAERLPAGDYICVVTVKNTAGKLSQRLGTVTVADKDSSVGPASAASLSPLQSQAVGPVEEDSSWTIVGSNENQTATVIAHDGSDGQVTRGRGALSFRLGDFFSGHDQEQMRLTEEGNLGIGTSKPEKKLDVAGDIRATGTVQASKGITFADGTLQTTGLSGRLDANGNVIPNVSGTGTQDQLSKWTDNGGTLGNSIITEAPGGFIGISNAAPQAKLVVDASSGAELRFDKGISGITPVLSVISQPGSTSAGGASILGAGSGGSSFVFSDNLPFFLVKDTKANVLNNNLGNGTVLFTLLPSGRVGIGNTSPQSPLDVAGTINTSAQYNIGGNRVLSVTGGASSFQTSNTFAGVDAGLNNQATNTDGIANSFFGGQAGASNTTGRENSFFGEGAGIQNVSGIGNSAFGRIAALSLHTGNFNSFFGDAAGAALYSGNNNTYIGALTNGSDGLESATAIGANARVTQSYSLVLGSINSVTNGGSDTNVGIGTTAPARKLHLSGVGSDSAGQTDLRVTGTGDTASGITLQSTGAGGGTYSLLSTANAASGGPNGGGRLAVFDVLANSYRMVIDSGGKFGIGTFTPDHTLTVNGNADKTGGGSWDVFSDERLKTIKGPYTPGLKALMQLQPLRYEYKPDNALGLKSSGEHIGFGAKAVEKIIPEAVSKNDKGYLLVNNDPILWTMLNAIKEQQLTIEKVKRENSKLKASNADAESRLAALETTVKRMAHHNRRAQRREYPDHSTR